MRKTRSFPSSRYLRPALTMEMEGGNVCPPRHSRDLRSEHNEAIRRSGGIDPSIGKGEKIAYPVFKSREIADYVTSFASRTNA